MTKDKIKFIKPRQGLTHQTKENAEGCLAQVENNGGFVTMDVVDPKGVVCSCSIGMRDGHLVAAKGTHDPRNLWNRLTRQLKLKSLKLAVCD